MFKGKKTYRFANKTDIWTCVGAVLMAVVQLVSTYREYKKTNSISQDEVAHGHLHITIKESK